MSFALYSYREFYGWNEEKVAAKLFISIADYKHLESGLEKIDAEMALKLSKLFKAPPQIFHASNWSNQLSIVYSHCHFNNSNGYVNHSYVEADTDKQALIEQLRNEVSRLRIQNDLLLKRIIERQ